MVMAISQKKLIENTRRLLAKPEDTYWTTSHEDTIFVVRTTWFLFDGYALEGVEENRLF